MVANELEQGGLGADEFAVIYSPNIKKDEAPLRRWYAEEQWRRLRRGCDDNDDQVTVDDESDLEISEVRARRRLIEAYKDPADPLKVLVVTDMLLTGFDAPIEQVMFLDKPLRGAKLLQAIMRTNRPFPEKQKDRGIVVDYWGVFDRLEAAFTEFSPSDVEMAVLDLSTLLADFPVRVAEALALVAGMPEGDDYDQMMWLLKRFNDDKTAAELFEERFQAAESAYEALTPDVGLAPYLDDYARLVRIRLIWRRGARLDDRDGDFDLQEYRPQTWALVRSAVQVARIRNDLPIYRINGEYLRRIEAAAGSSDEKAAEIEAALEYEIKVGGGIKNPVTRTLVERLEQIRALKADADADMLLLLEDLVREFVHQQEMKTALGLSGRAQGFLAVGRVYAPAVGEDDLVQLAREVDRIVERNGTFPGWEERDDVLRDIRRQTLKLLLRAEATKSLIGTPYIEEVLQVATARTAEDE